MTAINTLPRTLIKTYLQGLRLPLTTLEWVTNKSDAKDWPPAIAFEAFEGGAKRFLGSLIGDDELVHEGMLQRTKVDELARAERLEAMAAQAVLVAASAPPAVAVVTTAVAVTTVAAEAPLRDDGRRPG